MSVCQLYPTLRKKADAQDPTPLAIPIPPDPMSFTEMTMYDMPTSTPIYRQVDIFVIGLSRLGMSAGALLVRAEYRGESAQFWVLDWCCDRDILLGICMKEILAAAKRRRNLN